MDTVIEQELAIIQHIASTDDHPVLMVNLNRYVPGQFPNGAKYREWRTVNAEMIANVGGKILWTLPVKGQILVNGPLEPLDEILAYWYPSHRAFLEMRNFDVARKNFELRQGLVEYAVVHRCDGEAPPMLV